MCVFFATFIFPFEGVPFFLFHLDIWGFVMCQMPLLMREPKGQQME
jgi:hypothetical protein